MDLQKKVIFDGKEYTLWEFMFCLDVVRLVLFSKYHPELVSSLQKIFQDKPKK